nr:MULTISPECIES: transposase domain-containing protein [unclassified Mycetohabitans]
MIETCKVNRLEPYGYLVALFRAISLANTADEYPALLLWRAHLNTLTHGRAPAQTTIHWRNEELSGSDSDDIASKNAIYACDRCSISLSLLSSRGQRFDRLSLRPAHADEPCCSQPDARNFRNGAARLVAVPS